MSLSLSVLSSHFCFRSHSQDVLYEYTHPEQHFCEKTNLKRINSTDPGHATISGIASHFLAVGALVGTGLFASVLAPPAATGIIRDFSIKAGSKAYQGPAQKLVAQIFSGSAGASSTAAAKNGGHQASAILARNYQTKPTMSRLNKTTRMATSVHKF